MEIRGGINPAFATHTAINGRRAQETIQVSGVTVGVNIKLHGGNDQLFVGSGNATKPTVNLPDTVTIDTGSGDDRILLGGGPLFKIAVQTA